MMTCSSQANASNRTCTVAFTIVLAACLALQPADVAQAGLFGSDFFADALLSINTSTGVATQVGSGFGGPPFGAVGGLAFDRNTQTLYGIDGTTNDLITINTSSGAGTSVGDTTFSVDSDGGLAFDPNANVLYWADPFVADLYTVNTSTGVATKVGDFTSNIPIVGLAYDPNTDTLFGVSGVASTIDTLYTINTTSAALTTVGSVGVDGDSSSGLAFDPDTNTLYWADYRTDKLYTLNTSTGAASEVGDLVNFVELGGLAFSSPVPEPSSFLLCALAAAGAVGYGWRRKGRISA